MSAHDPADAKDKAHQREERATALRACCHHLLLALQQLREAHRLNEVHALGFELPSERPLYAAFSNVADHLLERERLDAEAGRRD